MSATIHQIITDGIISQIKTAIANGDKIAPWQKPWTCLNGGDPISGTTGKGYRGINWFLLNMAGHSSPFWFTFNKLKGMKGDNGEGCFVRKGEKGTLVVFWSPIEKIDKETGGKKKAFILRYYKAFNAEQVENIPSKYLPEIPKRDLQDMGKAEAIVKGWNECPIKHQGGRACYSPSSDEISMPSRESFKTCGHYFGTLFHEMIHATGHKSRLDRLEKGGFGSQPYALEELVAEMGAAMLCAEAGIEGIQENSISYLSSWLEKLQSNPDWLIKAAGKAQKAVDLILGRSYGAEGVAESEDSGEG
jgi:antirestriction protein ArdC